MDAGIYVTAALGLLTLVACVLATRAGRRLKQAAGQSAVWLSFYWIALGGYAAFFTAQRAAGVLGASDETVTMLFYLATGCGASTVVALSAIILQALWPGWPSGYATGLLTGMAAWVVYLIIEPGVIGPTHGAWSIEFLPSLVAVRILIVAIYMAIPVWFAVLVFRATHDAADSGRRLRMFSVSVLLIYEANAIKYVASLPDAVQPVLALAMAAGAYLGWRSYRVAEPAGNG